MIRSLVRKMEDNENVETIARICFALFIVTMFILAIAFVVGLTSVVVVSKW